jgi:hypothetical protein
MQSNAFALNWGPNCLFKGQVILDKQITPASQPSGVVFLQQNVVSEELLRFYRVDLGYSRIK